MPSCDECGMGVPRSSMVVSNSGEYCSRDCAYSGESVEMDVKKSDSNTGDDEKGKVKMECEGEGHMMTVRGRDDFPRLCPLCGTHWKVDHEWEFPGETRTDKV